MLHEINISAPAKVNIGLYVSPKRSDGFHDIDSIFTIISLSDDIYVSRIKENGVCNVQCEFLLPESNTITSTYNAFCEITGLCFGIQVLLKKRVPMGGGLGGGSSDAASVLFALEKIAGVQLSMEQRYYIASKVGSDVFFFLYCLYNNTKTAFVSGRGEIVKRIESRNDLYIMVVCPMVHSSTKEAYNCIDDWYRAGRYVAKSRKTEAELVQMYNMPISDWSFSNDFTHILMEKYPVIEQALSDIKTSGALFSDMSGSGSSLFGVYDSKEALEDSYRKLSGKWNCYAQLFS